MIIVAPDSYKGCLNASAVAHAIELGIRRVWPNKEIHLFPMADGGEGTLDVILTARSGVRLAISVAGINGAPVNVAYGVIDSATTPTAVIEIAQIVGLPLAQHTSVASRTTTGIGELIIHCLDQGIRRFLIGLGGSGTNDAGVGLLHALGARIVHDQGSSKPPLADSLKKITSIDFSTMDPRIKQCEIILLTDVDNPLTGKMGATQTYGPQKA